MKILTSRPDRIDAVSFPRWSQPDPPNNECRHSMNTAECRSLWLPSLRNLRFTGAEMTSYYLSFTFAFDLSVVPQFIST